ncbi:type II CAAX prenyl endopeptidase Rce1 family protein [Streptomyces sp. NPDC004629]|uniref:CPBP family glutamic-type intramembrane protease n=1 Tax=Streptomyces sp. NPDC004629 TaxID=3364705 RepID=UPI0036785C6E
MRWASRWRAVFAAGRSTRSGKRLVSVLVGGVVFAIGRGLDPVLPVAFVVGVVDALLLRRTGSVWPGVVVHGVDNALAMSVPVNHHAGEQVSRD